MNDHARQRVLVTGAGGFIGHHPVTDLKQRGFWVRGVDRKRPEFTGVDADEFQVRDLRREAARLRGVSRYFLSSSACVYPDYRQTDEDVTPLKEDDAYPADPQDAYGWEKLLGERLCAYYTGEFGLETRVARFHNIYGPYGTYDGGREKAPAALCRKVATAQPGGEVEIWGDGEQTRSFGSIDDCIEGIQRLMWSGYPEALNIGSTELVTVNELARQVIEISGKPDLTLRHVGGPLGVRGRNSDSTRIRQVLGWEPRTSLHDGLAETYRWIHKQVSG